MRHHGFSHSSLYKVTSKQAPRNLLIESKDLTEARVLLSKFEVEIERSEGLVHLSEALSLLADVAMDATSVELKQTCSNVASAYAKKVQAKVQPLLTPEPLS